MKLGGPDAPFGMEETVPQTVSTPLAQPGKPGFSISTATEALFHGVDFADASILERRRQVICGEFI
ncbi:hypothetical protein [Agrobacterium sp. B1(2019)]|uniref:hypothetical protein n=1 Tax=Agrobacterium sp. B1(2019) TaxID=2607032 RepID=UPI0011EC7CBF|nr:hypothetical protein [Agrobacterium sp. B1(2019)]TZG32912.1 hypothetical protein AGR1_20355 [Agrobacterium sp. B1(2019)]